MKAAKYLHLISIMENMPPLSMWPDRTIPYNVANNQILLWIIENCRCNIFRAEKIRDNMRARKTITFDPETKLWAGRKYQTSVLEMACAAGS